MLDLLLGGMRSGDGDCDWDDGSDLPSAAAAAAAAAGWARYPALRADAESLAGGSGGRRNFPP